MNTEHHTHIADIIRLFAPRPKPGKTFPLRVMVSAERPAAAYSRHEPATITAENFRLRKERYDAWREADAVMDYWFAAMKMHTAISCLQNFGAQKSSGIYSSSPKVMERWSINIGWRGAS
jgi:hypothetical protein